MSGSAGVGQGPIKIEDANARAFRLRCDRDAARRLLGEVVLAAERDGVGVALQPVIVRVKNLLAGVSRGE